jgi:hypothetical protein
MLLARQYWSLSCCSYRKLILFVCYSALFDLLYDQQIVHLNYALRNLHDNSEQRLSTY